MKGLRVTVFGSARPQPGTPDYQQAYDLGVLLGQAGCTVLTGGYCGTMEAVSRGAAEHGGHVIGVTCDEIEAYRPGGPNQWVAEERRFPVLRQRLYELIDAAEAAIALPGGIGTLSEISAMWSQMQTGSTPVRPLVLIGPVWQLVFQTLISNTDGQIAAKDRGLISFAPDPASAVALLAQLAAP